MHDVGCTVVHHHFCFCFFSFQILKVAIVTVATALQLLDRYILILDICCKLRMSDSTFIRVLNFAYCINEEDKVSKNDLNCKRDCIMELTKTRGAVSEYLRRLTDRMPAYCVVDYTNLGLRDCVDLYYVGIVI